VSVLIGAATAYLVFAGDILNCGEIVNGTQPPWAAVDISEMGRWNHGDRVMVIGPDWVYPAQIMDTGNLYPYYIDQWNAPIIVDIPAPAPFPGLSAPAMLVRYDQGSWKEQERMILDALATTENPRRNDRRFD
jgi:hypothetical protein